MSVAERTLLQLVAKQRPPPCVGIGHELPGRVGLGWPPPHMAGMEMQCVHHRFRCRCWKRPCFKALCSNPVLQNQKAELWILCVWRRTLQKGERRTRQIGTHTSLCTISLCCVLVRSPHRSCACKICPSLLGQHRCRNRLPFRDAPCSTQHSPDQEEAQLWIYFKYMCRHHAVAWSRVLCGMASRGGRRTRRSESHRSL